MSTFPTVVLATGDKVYSNAEAVSVKVKYAKAQEEGELALKQYLDERQAYTTRMNAVRLNRNVNPRVKAHHVRLAYGPPICLV